MKKVHLHEPIHPGDVKPGLQIEFFKDDECLECKLHSNLHGQSKTMRVTYVAKVSEYDPKVSASVSKKKKFVVSALTNLDDVSCLGSEYFVQKKVVLWFWQGYSQGGAIEDLDCDCIACGWHASVTPYYDPNMTFRQARDTLLERAREHLSTHD